MVDNIQVKFSRENLRDYLIELKGDYCDDRRHGYGICSFPNGYKYEGEWFEGKKHGRGIEIFPDGHRYNGIFEYDRAIGPSIEM